MCILPSKNGILTVEAPFFTYIGAIYVPTNKKMDNCSLTTFTYWIIINYGKIRMELRIEKSPIYRRYAHDISESIEKLCRFNVIQSLIFYYKTGGGKVSANVYEPFYELYRFTTYESINLLKIVKQRFYVKHDFYNTPFRLNRCAVSKF